jgi:hypothetical protein
MFTCVLVGHLCLTHSHLLHGELASVIINHHVPLTMSHILVGCPLYSKAYLAYHLNGALCAFLVVIYIVFLML